MLKCNGLDTTKWVFNIEGGSRITRTERIRWLGLSASLLAEDGILKLVVKVIVTSFTEIFLAF